MAGEAISASVDNPTTNPPRVKKKRNLPGTPDPEAEVIALSPKTLLATNRFLCEVCGKGFQRDQNLQLHRRGHNLPWKLRQRTPGKEAIRKRVYVCPERSCVHHNPSRALGDLTGIKKHFSRKHGEKKWKCDKCSKRYAVQSDCKAHSKTCGTREYRCDCGIISSRRDNFITHRAFCDALALETARVAAASNLSTLTSISNLSNFNFAGSLMSSNMAHSFPSNILKPTSAESELLSLWIGLGPQVENIDLLNAHQNQTKSLSNADLHGNLFSNGKQIDNQLNNWTYQNKLMTSSASDQLSSTTTLSMSSLKEADQNYSQSLPVSIPSLQSSQHHYQEMAIMPGISATGLLQKAARIGVTASSPSLLGHFEMNYYPNDSGDGFLHLNHSINSMEVKTSLDHGLSLPDQLSKICSTRHHADQKDFGSEEETRDFLGADAAAMNHGWI